MTLATSHPLPRINDPERLREVLTHASALGLPRGQLETDTGARSYERLSFLGDSVINMVVTAVLEENRPLSRPGDLARMRSLIVNQNRVATWSDAYALPGRLIVHSAQTDLIRRSTAAKVDVFHAYVGAVFRQDGYDAVEDWFGPVVEKAIGEILTIESEANLQDTGLEDTSTGVPPAPSGSSQSPPSPSNSSGASATAAEPPTDGILALFNQICSQKHIDAIWEFEQEGPNHAPRFTATLRTPGRSQPVAVGRGSSKKQAKQEAVKVAVRLL